MISSTLPIFMLLFLMWIGRDSFSFAQKIDYRLPFFHEIRYYNLSLELNPNTDHFKGELVAAIRSVLRTDFIIFHVSPSRINMKEILFNNKTACNFTYNDERTEMLNISCGIRMEENNEMYLVMKYEGTYGMHDKGDGYFGFYKSSYKTPEGETNYTFTLSEPIYARTFFPCYDEPHYKTNYRVTVKHPEKVNVLSNSGKRTQIVDDNG